MKRKQKSPVKTLILMLFLTAAIVAVYFVMSSKNDQSNVEAKAEETEVEKLLGKKIEKNYPATPREVIKLYSRMLKCMYGEEMTDRQIEEMSLQVRKLFDDELLEQNPEKAHLDAIEADIAGYRMNGKSIISYNIEKAGDVVYNTIKGRECATLRAYYTVKQKTEYTRSYEEFILRRNEKGEWKILGWRQSSSGDMNFE